MPHCNRISFPASNAYSLSLSLPSHRKFTYNPLSTLNPDQSMDQIVYVYLLFTSNVLNLVLGRKQSP